jgi:hypothetical protein
MRALIAPIEHKLQIMNHKSLVWYKLAAVIIILWLLGLVSSYTMGGFVHVLLVIALVMVLTNFIYKRA